MILFLLDSLSHNNVCKWGSRPPAGRRCPMSSPCRPSRRNRTYNRPEYKCRKSSLSKPTIWSISSASPFTIWRRRPDWFPCSTMSMQFRSAISRCRTCQHATELFTCAGIRCTHYSKAAILSFTSRYTTCSTGFSGVKCTLYRPMSMGTSS